MILYCVICYLIMLGMIITDSEKKNGVYKRTWIILIFSPILLPMFIGRIIQQQNHK